MNKTATTSIGYVLLGVFVCLYLSGCLPFQKETKMSTDPDKARIDARTMLYKAAENPNPEVRCHAIEALGKTMGKHAGGIYMQALNDKNPAVRFAAAMVIGDIKYKPAKDRLQKMASGKGVEGAEPDKRTYCAVLYALHELGNDTHTGDLTELLFDREAEIRANAALAMGKMGKPSAIEPLEALLADEKDPAVKLQITESLAMLGDSRSAEMLEAYTKGLFLDLRLAAIPAVAKYSPKRAQTLCTNLLDDRHPPRVRVAAAGALARTGMVSDLAYQLCIRAAKEPRKMMRETYENKKLTSVEINSLQRLAAIALGRMDRPKAADVLYPLLKSNEGAIRVAVAMSILRLFPDVDVETTNSPKGPSTRPATKKHPRTYRLHSVGGKD